MTERCFLLPPDLHSIGQFDFKQLLTLDLGNLYSIIFNINDQEGEVRKINSLVTRLKHHRPTFFHCLRVSFYSRILGQSTGLSEKERETVAIGGLLHDIGKLALSSTVLNRADNDGLTLKQKNLINAHAFLGGVIIREIGLPETYALIAEQHGIGTSSLVPTTEEVLLARHPLVAYVSIADLIAAFSDPQRKYQIKPSPYEFVGQLKGKFDQGIFPENLRLPTYNILEKLQILPKMSQSQLVR